MCAVEFVVLLRFLISVCTTANGTEQQQLRLGSSALWSFDCLEFSIEWRLVRILITFYFIICC